MSEQRTAGTDRLPRAQASPLVPSLFNSRLTGDGQPYMLLDAARDRQIYARLIELGEAVRVRSLYQGDIGGSLAHVSPYLLTLREDEPVSCWFAETGFGRSWGLFVLAPIGFDELRRHLRKFNMVYREDRTPLVFRFYDPRVLRRFLPTCNSDELLRFFGPIESFLIETEEADTLLRFTLTGGELVEGRLPMKMNV